METKQTLQLEVYRDGEIDKAFQRQQQIRSIMSNVGSLAYRGFEGFINALDEFVQSAQPR